MRFAVRAALAAVLLFAGLGSARADEAMDGSFRASRACPALVSIRKETNPGMVITGPGITYRLLARNRKQATHYRIEVPDAVPPERWVEAGCGKVIAADGASAPAPAAKPHPTDLSYVLALSWQPAFCEANRRRPECRWQTGSRQDANYLSLHGLWPQPSSREYCDLAGGLRAAGEGGRWKDLPAPELSLSTRTDLEAAMPGTQSLLERHEWAKHGSCYPGDAEAYFADSVRLLKEVNGSAVADVFLQGRGRRVTAADIRAAFDQSFGTGAGQRVRVACRDDGNRRLIAEITLSLTGDVPGGAGLSDLMLAAPPTDPGCPAGILDPVGPQ